MKTPYAKFIIGAIMMSAPGYAAAQCFGRIQMAPEYQVRFEKELKLSRQAKMDTIYKYEHDNLYIYLQADLNEHAKLRLAETKPVNKRIRAACRQLSSRNEVIRDHAEQDLLHANEEYNRIHEKYNKLDLNAINDIFVKSLITREYLERNKQSY